MFREISLTCFEKPVVLVKQLDKEPAIAVYVEDCAWGIEHILQAIAAADSSAMRHTALHLERGTLGI